MEVCAEFHVVLFNQGLGRSFDGFGSYSSLDISDADTMDVLLLDAEN